MISTISFLSPSLNEGQAFPITSFATSLSTSPDRMTPMAKWPITGHFKKASMGR
ncbi:MAG: hypothetical protein QME90_02830 [Thermodesulfobacteriota bacterium]|nr:hypothetical protein [Thermodesulfobacteriota bacterium]